MISPQSDSRTKRPQIHDRKELLMTVSIRWLVIALAASVLGAVGVAAAAPPAYQLAQQPILVEGRAVAALVRAGDAESVYSRFTPDLAQAVPLAQVQQVLTGAISTAPIGARTTESALPISPSRRSYAAVHRWGKRTIVLQVLLDAGGKIAAIDLAPPSELPRDPHAGRRVRAQVSLPFQGTWWVFWGGPTQRQNYHALAADQRHAYDFVVWRNGATYRDAGTKNADYWAWGRTLVAPATGLVVEAVDGVRDNRPQVQVENRNDPAGNHVVLDLGNGEYALVAHMQKGSVRVRVGDRIRPGDVLGLTGNSGNSSEPHLHFHIQDRPGLFAGARGLPISFVGYRADGRRIDRGSPIQGQFIEREGS
jgi:murein DD-endopeptidase MepM/ murein hydrolase activator NlpD